MGNPEIKVLIEEISKLRSELIEMKIEIESLKADISVIGEINKVNSNLKVVGENTGRTNNKFTLIKNKKIDSEEKKKKVDELSTKEFIKLSNENIKSTISKAKVEKERISEDDFKIDKKDMKNFREKLKDIMKSEVRYDTWLKTGVENLSKISKTHFKFPAANDFTRGIVEVRYKDMVLEVLKAVFPEAKSIEIVAID
ncbi:hypothetical protein [uncultured Clostridium sp.]|uniref:hypothetical protein n=1 Tax=uncultured Clostridium sp. TaxID=59620 RepID=UPI0026312258|nr:hypothetical protein [uncultured Clostridium sp.]